tara:strand:- start:356 stop:601 length:246 start_codon:yes stop_codon:yes gene_type:complete
MSKDLEILKADVKKLMLKDWTKTEVEKLSEFMEDVIIATMVVNKLPIHVVVKSFYCQTGRCDKSKNKQCDECGLVELNNMQ